MRGQVPNTLRIRKIGIPIAFVLYKRGQRQQMKYLDFVDLHIKTNLLLQKWKELNSMNLYCINGE